MDRRDEILATEESPGALIDWLRGNFAKKLPKSEPGISTVRFRVPESYFKCFGRTALPEERVALFRLRWMEGGRVKWRMLVGEQARNQEFLDPTGVVLCKIVEGEPGEYWASVIEG